ncbi:PH domain-containing protein [Lysobacter sp. S4-A87]|uniref:PH domain-containing protein n=1 Tax=Lysobacter sp. S4-A87 TaxID=2925843 RepID=UPI001F5359A0|nr:PH domain-containing protein [Lysobacter sp. S4-A87]UNK48518.1 PH domain-containing protein [Lysobacter sp. S4-A87]
MNGPVTATEPERRLHPMSWLFVLLQQLKQFIVPLAVLLFFGRGDRNELWPLIGVAVLVVTSLWQYFTYRYGVAGDHLVVRSGLLERSLRVIPFARIHNVALQQSLLHRVFGVAEVRLESAGGAKPEAQMRVLKLDDALALEALVRRRGAAADVVVEEPAADILLTLPPAEVLRLGIVSNRGMLVVGAAFAGSAQFSPKLIPNLFEAVGTRMFGYAGEHGFGPAEYAAAGLAVFAVLVGALRLLSMLLALLQYFGFTLSEQDRRLTVERGLLARWRTSASRRRIQAWTLREGVLHRWLKRRSLEVDTAVAEDGRQQRALRELAPIATPGACDALIEHLLPRATWSQLAWQPLPASSWWRLFLPSLPWVLIVTVVLCARFGAWGLLALLWLPWSAFKARRRAQRAAYAVGEEVIAVREGWWTRHWRFAEIDKLQALQLTRSPIDRRCGTATLWLDTSGAGAMAPPLRVRFLPEADARALYERLASELARRPLRW